MPRRDIVVIGGSAGALPVLIQLLGALPANLPAALFVVIHLSPHAESHLGEILTRAGPLPAAVPADGEPVRSGCVYVAPPDRHLVLRDGQVRVHLGARESHFRPAINRLFRSAARAYGPRVAGVLLSGHLSDGVKGLLAIRRHGGVTLVQDPAEALHPSMPLAALAAGAADHVAPVCDLGAMLLRLCEGTESVAVSPAPVPAAAGGDGTPEEVEAEVIGVSKHG